MRQMLDLHRATSERPTLVWADVHAAILEPSNSRDLVHCRGYMPRSIEKKCHEISLISCLHLWGSYCKRFPDSPWGDHSTFGDLMQIELQIAYFFTTSSTPKAQRLAWAPRTCQGTYWGKPGSIYSITLAVPKHKMKHTLYHLVTLHSIPWPYITMSIIVGRQDLDPQIPPALRHLCQPHRHQETPRPQSRAWQPPAGRAVPAIEVMVCYCVMSYGMMCVCVRVHGYMVIVCYWHTDCGHTDCVWM